jgi:hypothetical protein
MSDDITIEILESIRDEIRGTNVRLERLEKRQVETEIRLATEIVAVAGAVHTLTEAFKDDGQVRAAVRDHEKRLTALEKRVRR